MQNNDMQKLRLIFSHTDLLDHVEASKGHSRGEEQDWQQRSKHERDVDDCDDVGVL